MNRRTFFLAFAAVVSAPMVLAKGRLSANEMAARRFLAEMEKIIPGFSKLAKYQPSQCLLRGELPRDVEDFIRRKARERGNYAALRDLGFDSLRTYIPTHV